MRLLELQIHGKEVSELRRNKSEVLALCKQLEQKVAQKDVEIIRLHQQCQDLVQMVKWLTSNKLIFLLASNTCIIHIFQFCIVQTRNMRPTQTQNACAFFAHTHF